MARFRSYTLDEPSIARRTGIFSQYSLDDQDAIARKSKMTDSNLLKAIDDQLALSYTLPLLRSRSLSPARETETVRRIRARSVSPVRTTSVEEPTRGAPYYYGGYYSQYSPYYTSYRGSYSPYYRYRSSYGYNPSYYWGSSYAPYYSLSRPYTGWGASASVLAEASDYLNRGPGYYFSRSNYPSSYDYDYDYDYTPSWRARQYYSSYAPRYSYYYY